MSIASPIRRLSVDDTQDVANIAWSRNAASALLLAHVPLDKTKPLGLDPRAHLIRVRFRYFRPTEEDLRRVIKPYEKHRQRAGSFRSEFDELPLPLDGRVKITRLGVGHGAVLVAFPLPGETPYVAGLTALGDVTDVARDDPVVILHIDVADELDFGLLPAVPFQGQVLVPDVDLVLQLFRSLDTHASARIGNLPVARAGEDLSEKWMDLAKDYTENGHHITCQPVVSAVQPQTTPNSLSSGKLEPCALANGFGNCI